MKLPTEFPIEKGFAKNRATNSWRAWSPRWPVARFVPGSARSTLNPRLSMESRVNGDPWTRNSATTVHPLSCYTYRLNERRRNVSTRSNCSLHPLSSLFSLSLSLSPFLSFHIYNIYIRRPISYLDVTNSFTANRIISSLSSINLPRAYPSPLAYFLLP